MKVRGFSLPELLLVVTLFSAFLLSVHYLLSAGLQSWRRTASSQDARIQLSKAHRALQDDLRATGITSCEIADSASLATPTSGSVLWLLSALDSNGSQRCRKEDGTPFWQRNVLYYLCTPTDHDKLFGTSCQVQPFFCPHKVLVRRVYDAQLVTRPTSPEANIEELMSVAQIKTRALPPRNLNSAFPGAPSEKSEIVATGLLDFTVTKGSEGWPGEVVFRLKAFQADSAGKVSRIGQEDLRNSPFTHEALGSVFPGN